MIVENILTNLRVIFNSYFYCGSAIKRFQSGIWNLFVLYGVWCFFNVRTIMMKCTFLYVWNQAKS